jgi:hypothetical protein
MMAYFLPSVKYTSEFHFHISYLMGRRHDQSFPVQSYFDEKESLFQGVTS